MITQLRSLLQLALSKGTFAFVLLFVFVTFSQAQSVYRYVDNQKVTHYVGNIDDVPLQYRDQTEKPHNLPPIVKEDSVKKTTLSNTPWKNKPTREHVAELLQGLELTTDTTKLDEAVAATAVDQGQLQQSDERIANEKIKEVIAFIKKWILVIAILFLIHIATWWVLLERADMPGYGILIPFYNLVLMSRLGGYSGWWWLVLLVPVVGTAIWGLSIHYGIARNFGRGELFSILTAILPMIFLPIIAFGGGDEEKAHA